MVCAVRNQTIGDERKLVNLLQGSVNNFLSSTPERLFLSHIRSALACRHACVHIHHVETKPRLWMGRCVYMCMCSCIVCMCVGVCALCVYCVCIGVHMCVLSHTQHTQHTCTHILPPHNLACSVHTETSDFLHSAH